MKKTEIVNKISAAIGKTGLSLKQHSPEIFIVVGIGGVVASTVMACIATTKLKDVLEVPNKELERIHNRSTNECEPESGEPYTKEMIKKDTAMAYFKAGLNVAKLYLPAVTVGIFSLSSIVASNNILRKRNIALASAYVAIDRSFREYRERVIDRFGKDTDTQLRFNVTPIEVEKEITDENGNTTVVKESVYQLPENGIDNEFARVFDESNPEWRPSPDYNRMKIEATEAYLNNKLKVQGYVFLNEVYTALGFSETKAGQIVGWKYDENNPSGDNFIDLGIHDVANPKVRGFLNGEESSIIIAPNVDGDILTDFDKIASAY